MTIDNRSRFTLRIPDDLKKELQAEAQRMGIPLNALILQILDVWEKGTR